MPGVEHESGGDSTRKSRVLSYPLPASRASMDLSMDL